MPYHLQHFYAILVRQTQVKPELIGFVSPDEQFNHQDFLGSVTMIEDMVKINKVDELIFCAKDLTSQTIISTMLRFTNADIDFKIAPPESLSVIGSNSINTAGDLYVVHFNTLSRQLNRRKKRMFDLVVSILFLLLLPVFIWFVIHPLQFVRNILTILFGLHSWVGYHPVAGESLASLPRLRPGIVTPACKFERTIADDQVIEKINMLYAKDYTLWNDSTIIWKGFRQLGSRPKILNPVPPGTV